MSRSTASVHREWSGAAEANFKQTVRNVQRWPAVAVSNSDQLLQGVTSHPFPLFNWALGQSMQPEGVDRLVRIAADRCRRQGVGMLWCRFPVSQPAELTAALERHGFQCDSPTPIMARRLSGFRPTAAVPEEMSVAPAATSGQLDEAAAVMHAGFQFPAGTLAALREMTGYMADYSRGEGAHFVGYWQGQPAAAGSVIFCGDIAGLYNIATLPAFQRRGVGGALTDGMLAWAAGQGAKLAVLEASAMGLPVYQRLGFEQAGEMFFHVLPPPA